MFNPAAPTLKNRLSKGEPLGVFWFTLGNVSIIEAAIAAGADAVVIDMQHGLFDRTTLEAAIAVVPAGVPCLVRVEDDSATAIGRALDAGAEGVIVPLVETGKQAARAVSA
jgi:2-dehydro-3-deoxyglucarate aldolase/4-hydroxy-2-oxoheptanedioate aldolase